MWVQENLNPAGKQIGDCVIRAIAKATGGSWEDVYLGLCAQGYHDKDLPNANSTWGRWLKLHGWRRYPIPDNCADCYPVRRFCEDHPSGTYVLALQNHAVSSVYGNYVDTWDSGDEPVIYYWSKE